MPGLSKSLPERQSQSTQSPYFSVLIPTKNRAHLVGGAIESVLSQTYADFEIIVVDNDDRGLTAKEVKRHEDPRIRYFRTGGLSMVANWQFAIEQVRGKVVTVLEDKMSFRDGALGQIAAVLERHEVPVVVWGTSGREECSSRDDNDESQELCVDSRDVLASYVSGNVVWAELPRIINSCVTLELINRISDQFPTKHFFNYFSPDLVAAFSQLALVEKYVLLEESLIYKRSEISNATLFRHDTKKGVEYFGGKQGLELSDIVSEVPVKAPSVIQNTIYNDFLRTRRILGRGLRDYEMSSFAYAKVCLRELAKIHGARAVFRKEMGQFVKYSAQNLSFKEFVRLGVWWCALVGRFGARRSKAFVKKTVFRVFQKNSYQA